MKCARAVQLFERYCHSKRSTSILQHSEEVGCWIPDDGAQRSPFWPIWGSFFEILRCKLLQNNQTNSVFTLSSDLRISTPHKDVYKNFTSGLGPQTYQSCHGGRGPALLFCDQRKRPRTSFYNAFSFLFPVLRPCPPCSMSAHTQQGHTHTKKGT